MHVRLRLIALTILVVMLVVVATTSAATPSTVAEIQQAYAGNTTTCVEIIKSFLATQAELEPTLNACLSPSSISSAALTRAYQLDALPLSARSFASLPLGCVPVVVKGNYNLPGIPTSAGVEALATNPPPVSAQLSPVSSALLESGGVLVCVGNMPDFAANGMNTISSVAGQTHRFVPSSPNKTDDRTPYGSSGGPAVAMSASYGVIGLGTDTDGSIQNPSSAAGLYGLRGTAQLVKTTGILPLSPFQDVSGPIMSDLKGMALVYAVIQDLDSDYYSKGLDDIPLAKASLAYLTPILAKIGPQDPAPSVVDAMNATLAALDKAGTSLSYVEIQDPVVAAVTSVIANSSAAAGVCGTSWFAHSVDLFLEASLPKGAPIASLKDVYASGRFLHGLGGVTSLLEAALQAPPTTDPDVVSDCHQYNHAQEVAATTLEQWMVNHNVDAFIYPAENQPPPYLPAFPPPQSWYGAQLISAFTGLPAFVIPSPFDPDVGLTLLGRRDSERTLFALASSFRSLQQ